MNNEEEIKILEKSFDLMEKFIINCYVKNDERSTRLNIKDTAKALKKACKNEIDLKALMEAVKKLDSLSFLEIEEIYDILV